MVPRTKIPLVGEQALTRIEAHELVAYLDDLIEHWPDRKKNPWTKGQKAVARARDKLARAVFFF